MADYFDFILNDLTTKQWSNIGKDEIDTTTDAEVDKTDPKVVKLNKKAMELALFGMAEDALQKNLKTKFLKAQVKALVEKMAKEYFDKTLPTVKEVIHYKNHKDAEDEVVMKFLRRTIKSVEDRLKKMEKTVKELSTKNKDYKNNHMCKRMGELEKNLKLLLAKNKTYEKNTDEIGETVKKLEKQVQLLLIPKAALTLLLSPLTKFKGNTKKCFNTQYPILDDNNQHLLSVLKEMGFTFKYRDEVKKCVTCTFPTKWQNNGFISHVKGLRKKRKLSSATSV